MPIFDSDETTVYEISKLYESDGTVDHQIGKVYDNDGTTDYLIYSAETEFLNGSSYDSLTGGWGFNQGAKTSTLESTGLRIYPVGGAYTKNAIDLTPYKTLLFDVQCADGGTGGGGLTTWVGYTEETNQIWGENGVRQKLTSADRYTHSIDVSNVTGSFYIGARCSNYGDIPMYVYSIIGVFK